LTTAVKAATLRSLKERIARVPSPKVAMIHPGLATSVPLQVAVLMKTLLVKTPLHLGRLSALDYYCYCHRSFQKKKSSC